MNVEIRGPTTVAIRIGRGKDVANYNARAHLNGIILTVKGALTELEKHIP